jgi:RNA polymerase sigma-70 factor, ECF subfamily
VAASTRPLPRDITSSTGRQREFAELMVAHRLASRNQAGRSPCRCCGATALVLAIIAKIGEFRGESRFTTWASKFVIFEVSGKIGRHFWRHPAVRLEAGDWDRLPDRFGLDPARESEWRCLVRALRRAVEEELTEHQRRVFTAIVVDSVPLDALVAELGSSRNALYKTMFDARRKLRASLVASGYLHEKLVRQS